MILSDKWILSVLRPVGTQSVTFWIITLLSRYVVTNLSEQPNMYIQQACPYKRL
jgi:hypothetical protein